MIIVRIVQFVKIVQLVQLDYYGYIKFFGRFVGTWVGAFTLNLAITLPTNRAKLEPFDKTNAGNPHKYRLSAFPSVIQTLFRVRFFILLYCYFVSKPYHSDTILCLVNMVSKLLYPNCTHHKFWEQAS